MTSYVIDYQLHSTKVQVIALVSIAYDEHRDYPNKQISLIVLLEEQKKKLADELGSISAYPFSADNVCTNSFGRKSIS